LLGAKIKVDALRVAGRIDPHIYGFNIEFLQRLIGPLGIWAEMLENRKFEAPDFNHDGVSEPWRPFGRSENAIFVHDSSTSYCADYSQRIQSSKGMTCHGIEQPNISLVAGKKYVGYVHARQQGVIEDIIVSLNRVNGWTYDSCVIQNCDTSWRKYSFELISPVTDTNASFAIKFLGEGKLWVDAVSLMPADNFHGMRKDVIDLIEPLKPSIVRWPGGCFADGYHWMNGVGPRDKRPVTYDPAWKKFEENDFGTDEFIQFCQKVGAEPYICINFGSGTPEESAHWVEYCNGEKETTWGAKRAENGYAQPYGVEYWGIGNETYGFWEVGDYTNPASYAERFIEFNSAMRDINPKIKVVAVGTGPFHPRIKSYIDPSWNERVLETAGRYFNYLSMHYYTPEDLQVEPSSDQLYAAIVAAPTELDMALRDLHSRIVETISDQEVKIALDEWNVNVHRPGVEPIEGWTFPFPFPEQDIVLRNGLFAALVLNTLQRLCKDVTMANLFPLVNVDETGNGGCIITNKTSAHTTPLYLVFKMYRDYSGTLSVARQVQSPTFRTMATGGVPSLENVPYIDCSASIGENSESLHLMVVNKHPNEDVNVEIAITGFTPSSEAEAWEVNGPDIISMNEFDNPDVVRLSRRSIKNASTLFSYVFPAHSATAMLLRIQNKRVGSQ
jgi:alpha-N-arabinofuranosidase